MFLRLANCQTVSLRFWRQIYFVSSYILLYISFIFIAAASFDPDVLIPFESFRKHVQRGCARLLNRVAFLLFLQCEVIGVERSIEFIAGRLTHTDFTDLAASLPPLEGEFTASRCASVDVCA